MGLFDEFVGTCPHCGGEFYSQTKLTECEMRDYRIGDKIDLPDQRLRLRDPCSKCDKDVVVAISYGHVASFEKGGAQIKEGPFGTSWAISEEEEES